MIFIVLYVLFQITAFFCLLKAMDTFLEEEKRGAGIAPIQEEDTPTGITAWSERVQKLDSKIFATVASLFFLSSFIFLMYV